LKPIGQTNLESRVKNFGDAHRVPFVVACCLLQLVSAFCCFSSLLSFWLPWIYSTFPLFMEFRNGVLLQLIECIESTQNEVKRKMIETRASTDAPKSHARLAREEKVRVTSQLTLPWSPIPLGPPRTRSKRTLAAMRGANPREAFRHL
jgi:hypothetical protein